MAGLSITYAPVPGVVKAHVSDVHRPLCTLALTPGWFTQMIASSSIFTETLPVSNQQYLQVSHLVEGEEHWIKIYSL